MQIVASGHISDAFDDQVKELNAIAAEGPDALILISNRMDIENTTDEKWIEDTEKLIAQLPQDMPLGVYECPKPYKRLLSEKMIKWCAASGRFYFIKDTCCDAAIIRQRLKWCEGSNLKIFNANAQTMLESAKDGCFGYCGVMANFHPALYVKLLKPETLYTKETSLLQDFLGLAATIEPMTAYPCCAKYYLNKFAGITMEPSARSADVANLTDYQKNCVDQLAELAEASSMVSIRAWIVCSCPGATKPSRASGMPFWKIAANSAPLYCCRKSKCRVSNTRESAKVPAASKRQ